MINQSVLEMIIDEVESDGLREKNAPCCYDLAVAAMMRVNPHLDRASAARLLNALLETVDPRGRMDTSFSPFRGVS